jgi:hypothetical protein
MKNTYLHLLAVVFGLMLISCGSDGGESPTGGGEPEPENTAPTAPSQIYPLDNTICIGTDIVFQWNASTDAEGNAISYRVEIAENDSFSPIRNNETSFSESRLISLEKGKAYYWRIKAVDNRNAESTYSPVMQFVTEGDGVTNHVPFPPTLVSPGLDDEINGTTVDLSWTASDVDGDTLSYDVYLDTNEDPVTKVSDSQTETSYSASGLSASTKYYFKIKVKDGNGATSVGQVWSFTTK